MSDLDWMDATGMADLVRRREVTPLELVERTIAKIERLNPTLNAVVTKMYDIARARAASELGDAPFAGVPFLLKDLLGGYAGVKTTGASHYTKDFVALHNSELVNRHLAAGLIVVGKTNTPEFGLPPTTEPVLFGATKNPWNTAHSPGGSSGGAAAAVASGIVPMAHGGDGGGSIRIPASCCGIFGIKPTRGRNPLGPDIGDINHGMVVEHALTRSVRDSARLLDATEGMDIGAPYAAPEKKRPFAEEVGAPVGKLRIAISKRPLVGGTVHADCVAAFDDAAKLLSDLGHEVFEADLKVANAELLSPCFIALWCGGATFTLEAWSHLLGRPPKDDEIEPLTKALADMGRQTPLGRYLLANAFLQRASREIQRQFVDFDLLMTPTLAEPPIALGALDPQPGNPLAGFMRAAQYTPFTPIFNVTGQPAMSVPLYWNEGGLPIGTHFIGRFGDEATLFRLAAQLEQARPWAKRRPKVAA